MLIDEKCLSQVESKWSAVSLILAIYESEASLSVSHRELQIRELGSHEGEVDEIRPACSFLPLALLCVHPPNLRLALRPTFRFARLLGGCFLFFAFFLRFFGFSLLTTFAEIKADTFKLLFLYKRPVPR